MGLKKVAWWLKTVLKGWVSDERVQWAVFVPAFLASVIALCVGGFFACEALYDGKDVVQIASQGVGAGGMAWCVLFLFLAWHGSQTPRERPGAASDGQKAEPKTDKGAAETPAHW